MPPIPPDIRGQHLLRPPSLLSVDQISGEPKRSLEHFAFSCSAPLPDQASNTLRTPRPLAGAEPPLTPYYADLGQKMVQCILELAEQHQDAALDVLAAHVHPACRAHQVGAEKAALDHPIHEWCSNGAHDKQKLPSVTVSLATDQIVLQELQSEYYPTNDRLEHERPEQKLPPARSDDLPDHEQHILAAHWTKQDSRTHTKRLSGATNRSGTARLSGATNRYSVKCGGTKRFSVTSSYHTQGVQGEIRDKMLAIFDVLDEDHSQKVNEEELVNALRKRNQSPGNARKLISQLDKNGDGAVDRKEWETLVDDALSGKKGLAIDFLESVVDDIIEEVEDESLGTQMVFQHCQPRNRAKARKDDNKPMERCMIAYSSKTRLIFDSCLLGLLIYVALVMPFELGFLSEGNASKVLAAIEVPVEFFFMLDILLNFRTTYLDSSGHHIKNGKTIAKHYLRTWFSIDLVSAFPFEQISQGLLPSMEITKVTKVGKALKFIKMWRLLKISKVSTISYLKELLSDYMAVSGGRSVVLLISVFVSLIMLCHWLACGMPIVGDGFLSRYEFDGPTVASKYVCCLYWTLTSVTTVGYGDITPSTDIERLYTMVCIIIGGAGYSCVMGNIFVILNNRNLNSEVFEQRLRQTLAFLDHHEMPKWLRHRVWRYIKRNVGFKSASDPFSVMGDLSPELRQAVAYVIVPDTVRDNILFYDCPSMVISFLSTIIVSAHADSGDMLAWDGDYAYAMCVVTEGSAVITRTRGLQKSRESALEICKDPLESQIMMSGDSFGEEILIGITKAFQYCIVANAHVKMTMIPVEEFMQHFGSMPDIMQKFLENFQNDISQEADGEEDWETRRDLIG